MALDVNFRVSLPNGGWADEGELAQLASELRGRDPLDGALAVSGGEGEVVIEDELAALAHNMALRAAAALAAGGDTTVEYFDKPGSVRFRSLGEQARISGDFVSELVVARTGLVEGLLACADRIAAFLGTLGSHDWQADNLAAEAARTRDAVGEGAGGAPEVPPG